MAVVMGRESYKRYCHHCHCKVPYKYGRMLEIKGMFKKEYCQLRTEIYTRFHAMFKYDFLQ